MRSTLHFFFKYFLLIPVAALALAGPAGSGLTGCGYDCVHVRLTDGSLPTGVAGVEYRFDLHAESGCGLVLSSRSFFWSVTSGDLPPGVSVNSEGQIRGTPTLPGVFTITVEAIHPSRGVSAQKGFSITINAP